ncbi:hypothetical protein Tco_0161527 [Tanacetum coccineum]
MSEAEPIPPTSSVTALRIPMIKKGEYDLWSMKMRQYIAITDHILWDIITNGDQATTDPVSSSGPVSAPKTSLAANARRNNEKALNILLSAIPDRHLLSFHDAEDAKTLWSAIKARFGGNEASKKMQKNLLKQQFETFTIGSREELDSAYERFQNILSMLELYDAKVSHEDANLKFLRSLPSVWHVVATMIRGQPGLDELEFDDLYNNLKVYEHELKGVSNSSSQNIAFLSTEIKGSTLKQSTADPENIPKGYTQAASSKVQTAPNCASHSDEIICGYDNCKDKKIVAIEDSNSKALVATDNNEEIDWTKEFDAEPVTFAMMALTELEEDDWSMEIDAEPKEDWGIEDSNSKLGGNRQQLKILIGPREFDAEPARTEILGYQMSLESLEVILKTHEKNEYAWGDKYEQMEYDLKMRDLKLEEKQKELDQALRGERDDFRLIKLENGFGVEYSSSEENNNSSGDETLVDPLYENFKREKAYKAVPPPTGQSEEEEDSKTMLLLSGCSGMTEDKDMLSDFKSFKRGKDEEVKMLMYIFIDLQVTPKVSHLHAVKRIFRYLKHQPKLGLWYPKDSLFHLEAFSDSDYAGDNHDRTINFREVVNYLEKTGLLQCNEKKQLGYLLYRSRICSQLPNFDPDLIGLWLQQFWATASLRVINDVPHIRAMIALPKQVNFGTCSEIWYEEVVTALAAEEAHSTSPHSRDARDAQGLLKFKVLLTLKGLLKFKYANTTGTAEVQRYCRLPRKSAPCEAKETKMKQKKKMSSVKLGRNKEEGTLSEEHYVQDDYTADPFFEDIVDKDAAVTPDIERKSDETEALERKSDETEEINVEEKEASNVTLNFDDEAGPSSPIRPTQNIEPEEQFKVDEVLADISLGPRGILVEEPKKKKLTLQQIRALETSNDEEVAKKIQAEWDAEEERKRLEELKKAKPKTTSLAQGYKNLQKLKYPQMKELYDKPSKKLKLRTETVDEIRNYLRIVDFEKSVQDKESLEGISMITELQVIDSPDGQYLIIHRANNHFRAFDTLWEILHILDRQDLQHLYRVVQSYFEHIPPTGLGLILLGDLTTIWETPETSDDDFWKNQEDWEIIRDNPLSRELMIRMLDHGMEVEDESEIAITLIHLFILWTTEDGDNP